METGSWFAHFGKQYNTIKQFVSRTVVDYLVESEADRQTDRHRNREKPRYRQI